MVRCYSLIIPHGCSKLLTACSKLVRWYNHCEDILSTACEQTSCNLFADLEQLACLLRVQLNTSLIFKLITEKPLEKINDSTAYTRIIPDSPEYDFSLLKSMLAPFDLHVINEAHHNLYIAELAELQYELDFVRPLYTYTNFISFEALKAIISPSSIHDFTLLETQSID